MGIRWDRVSAIGPIGNVSAQAAWCPFWLLFLGCVAVLIYDHFVRKTSLHRKRRERNKCETCGYNLTGLTEPRCPECGSAFRTREVGNDFPEDVQQK